MHSYFVLCQARSWALFSIESMKRKVDVCLDVEGLDPSWVWFLKSEIPQTHGCVKLSSWNAIRDGNHIVYSYNDEQDQQEKQRYYIRLFDGDHDSVNAALYDDADKIVCHVCLVVYDKDKPHITNQAYAVGRCPEQFNA
jgi:hypothetical protein